MKFTVQYIPMNKIKTDAAGPMTQHMRNLSSVLWDCMHLLIVRRDKKSGNYTLIGGQTRFEHLRKHTTKKYAPCIIDTSSSEEEPRSWWKRFVRGRSKTELKHLPHLQLGKLTPASMSVIRSFLKREPRFTQLTRVQQLKVLFMGVRYKQTTIQAMRASVDEMKMRKTS